MNTPTIIKYKHSKFWDDEFKSLTYINENFNDVEKLELWKSQGYSGKITGDMCDMRDQQPSWNCKFIEHYATLGWKDIGTSYYRMTTGTGNQTWLPQRTLFPQLLAGLRENK